MLKYILEDKSVALILRLRDDDGPVGISVWLLDSKIIICEKLCYWWLSKKDRGISLKDKNWSMDEDK
jgi:hypothetical protein